MPIWMLQALRAVSALAQIEGSQAFRHLLPDATDHMALFSRVDIRCVLIEPVAQVLAVFLGDPELESAVWNKDSK